MRNLALVFSLLAASAWAGECLLGVIVITDAGVVNNATTGYGAAGCAPQANGCAGACGQAFRIGTSKLLSVQCRGTAGAFIGVNSPAVDAGNGVQVAAKQFFTTSTGSVPQTAALPDGGSYVGGLVAVTCDGTAACTCAVSDRNGGE